MVCEMEYKVHVYMVVYVACRDLVDVALYVIRYLQRAIVALCPF